MCRLCRSSILYSPVAVVLIAACCVMNSLRTPGPSCDAADLESVYDPGCFPTYNIMFSASVVVHVSGIDVVLRLPLSGSRFPPLHTASRGLTTPGRYRNNVHSILPPRVSGVIPPFSVCQALNAFPPQNVRFTWVSSLLLYFSAWRAGSEPRSSSISNKRCNDAAPKKSMIDNYIRRCSVYAVVCLHSIAA